MPDPIPFHIPDITEAEIEAVSEVLRSRWLTTGAVTREFEARFANAVEADHAVALNSCTAALHLSLEALGVGPGDAVFIPTYTFAATGEVVRYVGAEPVLVDSEPDRLNIDPDHLRQQIEIVLSEGELIPRAVIPVHFAGYPAQLDLIWNLAREFKLSVIEDAAHAFPTTYNDHPIGWTPSDIPSTVCFSFYATKTITTGEGGMATTTDPTVADRMRLMSLHGLSSQAWNRYAGGGWRYDIVAPGYKYNLSDIASALGIVQLDRASEMASQRASIARAYDEAFRKIPTLIVPQIAGVHRRSWHLYALRVGVSSPLSHRDALINALKEDHGIGTSMHFIPLHLHSYYRDRYGYDPSDFPVALDAYERCLSLPIYSGMTSDQIKRVSSAVLEAHETEIMRRDQ